MTDQPPAPIEPLWRAKQLCEYLGISRRTLTTMVKEQRVPFLRVNDELRFRPEAIDAWLNAKSHTAVR